MLTLVLTRHGLTDRSVPEQHIGQHIDVSLNAAGRRQAEALGRRLAMVRFDRVISSPLFRAQETAEIVSRRSVRVETDPRLKEMDYGAWEGLDHDQIEERDRTLRREWEQAPDRIACPGGETGDDVARRVHAFLADLLAEHKAWHARASFRAATNPGGPATTAAWDQPVLVVGHSSTNRILVAVALGVPIAEYRKRFDQSQANLTVLRWDLGAGPADAVLVVGNDVGHLRGPEELPWAQVRPAASPGR